jgi:hypothetical protein
MWLGDGRKFVVGGNFSKWDFPLLVLGGKFYFRAAQGDSFLD